MLRVEKFQLQAGAAELKPNDPIPPNAKSVESIETTVIVGQSYHVATTIGDNQLELSGEVRAHGSDEPSVRLKLKFNEKQPRGMRGFTTTIELKPDKPFRWRVGRMETSSSQS